MEKIQSAIYKYKLSWDLTTELSLPKHSEFLCLKIQDGSPTVWYKHNPINDERITVTIIRRPTGLNMHSELFPGEDYIDTLIIQDEVYHFFFKH